MMKMMPSFMIPLYSAGARAMAVAGGAGCVVITVLHFSKALLGHKGIQVLDYT